MIESGEISDILMRASAVLDSRLFPVAGEIVSPVFATQLGLATDNDPALLIRFAGNEKGVAYQVAQSLGLLRNAEVVSEDAGLWKDIAAASFRFEDYNGMWQVSALDGRVSTLDNSSKRELGLTPLMQRVKEQLDPQNIFRHK